jgi:hypothetical protein
MSRASQITDTLTTALGIGIGTPIDTAIIELMLVIGTIGTGDIAPTIAASGSGFS